MSNSRYLKINPAKDKMIAPEITEDGQQKDHTHTNTRAYDRWKTRKSALWGPKRVRGTFRRRKVTNNIFTDKLFNYEHRIAISLMKYRSRSDRSYQQSERVDMERPSYTRATFFLDSIYNGRAFSALKGAGRQKIVWYSSAELSSLIPFNSALQSD